MAVFNNARSVFLVSFSFFYSSFVAFPCRTIIILIAKSSALSEDSGMFILPCKQSWWSSCNPSGGILIYSSNSSEALASVKFFAISPATTHFQIFSFFNSLINGGNLICVEENVLQAKKKAEVIEFTEKWTCCGKFNSTVLMLSFYHLFLELYIPKC